MSTLIRHAARILIGAIVAAALGSALHIAALSAAGWALTFLCYVSAGSMLREIFD